jgi:hypothetical protein
MLIVAMSLSPIKGAAGKRFVMCLDTKDELRCSKSDAAGLS